MATRPERRPRDQDRRGAARCRPVFPFGIGTKAANRPYVIATFSSPYLTTPVSPFHAEPLHYPGAALLGGDEVERHGTLVQCCTTIWTIIIGVETIGVLANFLTMGMSSWLRSRVACKWGTGNRMSAPALGIGGAPRN